MEPGMRKTLIGPRQACSQRAPAAVHRPAHRHQPAGQHVVWEL